MARAPYSKTCYLCGKKVYAGTGAYYRGRLYHKWCANLKRAHYALKRKYR